MALWTGRLLELVFSGGLSRESWLPLVTFDLFSVSSVMKCNSLVTYFDYVIEMIAACISHTSAKYDCDRSSHNLHVYLLHKVCNIHVVTVIS